jgi:hypothetical protein
MENLLSCLLVAVPLSANTIAFAAPAKCPVPGEVSQWTADFCMYSAATDDFAHPDVLACFNKQPEVRAAKTCSAKKKYKSGICAIVVRVIPTLEA